MSLLLEWQGVGESDWVLDFRMPVFERLEVRQSDLDGGLSAEPVGLGRLIEYQTSDSDFHSRVLASPRFAVPIRLRPGLTRIDVAYRSHGDGPVHPLWLGLETWRSQQTLADFLNGVYGGMLIPMLAVVVVVVVWGRERRYIAYGALLLATALALLSTQGYAFAYLWPNAPGFNLHVASLAGALMLAANAWYACDFFQLRTTAPRLYQAHLGLMLGLLLTLLWTPVADEVLAVVVVSAFYGVLAIVTAIRGVRLGLPSAGLHLAGVLSFVLFYLVLFLVAIFVINPWPRFDPFNLVKIGYLFDALFFCAAQVQRVLRQRARQAEQQRRLLEDAQALVEAETGKRLALARAERQNLILAGAGHDLSQPLASLRFAIEALREQSSLQPVTAQLDRTVDYAQSLLRDMLQQSREAHRSFNEPLVLGELFAQVAAAHTPAARAKGLTLGWLDSVREVNASQLLLSRILNNLVGNAVRYTSSGRVFIGVRRRAGGLELQVLDTGPGLPVQQMAVLQQPFQQGGQAAAEGYGLGLFIVRTLCEQCGYRFRVASEAGRGTTFGVWIPA